LGGAHGGKGSDYANLKKVMAAISTNDADLVLNVRNPFSTDMDGQSHDQGCDATVRLLSADRNYQNAARCSAAALASDLNLRDANLAGLAILSPFMRQTTATVVQDPQLFFL